MNLLENDDIRLRALEPDDVELLYRWENDPAVWGVSGTLAPFSRHVLKRFIAEQTRDIYQTRQARFVIEERAAGRPVGLIDLFDFDPANRRAGVGILIYEAADRGRGVASAALELLVDYSFGVLRLHQLYANIPAGNTASARLFEGRGFVRCGLKKDWLLTPAGWEDEGTYQLLKGR